MEKFSDEEFYTIHDGSFSVEITPTGEMGRCSGRSYTGKTYLLIGRGTNLATKQPELTPIRNNMILKGADGSIVITNSQFVRKLPVCPNCNHILT